MDIYLFLSKRKKFASKLNFTKVYEPFIMRIINDLASQTIKIKQTNSGILYNPKGDKYFNKELKKVDMLKVKYWDLIEL